MWKTLFTIMFFIFTMVLIHAVAGPTLELTGDAFKESRDLDTKQWDGEALITGMISSFFDGIMVAIFGILTWGVARAVRRERYFKGP